MENHERLIELFASVEKEAKQAQSSLKKLQLNPEAYKPQEEHVYAACQSILSCIRVVERKVYDK